MSLQAHGFALVVLYQLFVCCNVSHSLTHVYSWYSDYTLCEPCTLQASEMISSFTSEGNAPVTGGEALFGQEQDNLVGVGLALGETSAQPSSVTDEQQQD